MLGGMAAKWRWRARRAAEGKSTDRPNMVCGAVQVVWHKFAKYWDIEIREVPMSPGQYAMTSTTCWTGSTRTRSWSCRRSASPTPARMSW